MSLALLDTMAALVGFERSMQRLADSDKSRFGGEEDPPGQYLTNVRQRISTLRRKLALPFVELLSAIAAAWVVAQGFALFRFTSGQLGAMSAFVFAWAGLGRLGYSGQSFDGDTSVERGDDAIFHVLCWFGMYMAAAAML
jgi:hypothetical protein